ITLKVLFLYSYSLSSIEYLTSDANTVLAFVKQFLPSNPVIVEAGAYDGTDTQKMSRLWPYGIIHAFEPVPENFKKLKHSIRESKNVKCYQLALADKNGFSFFYKSEFLGNPGIPSASGSLLAPKQHLIYDKGVIFPKRIKVPTITLDLWAQAYKVPYIDF